MVQHYSAVKQVATAYDQMDVTAQQICHLLDKTRIRLLLQERIVWPKASFLAV